MASRVLVETILLSLAWAAALAVRPWRLLRADQGQVHLATPLLACVAVLPWMWSWPGVTDLPLALHWSGAPLVALLLGWPLAVPVLTVAGFSTMLTADATAAQALALTVWSGVLPATAVLALGFVVREVFEPHPVAYMLGRAFFVPMLALGGCALASIAVGHVGSGPRMELERVAVALLSVAEASCTCAVATMLIAYRPQWLATWSDGRYLGKNSRAVPVQPHR